MPDDQMDRRDTAAPHRNAESHAHDHAHGHERGHAHDHKHGAHGHHGHSHGAIDYNRAFAIGVALNLIFVAVEAAYGFIANSLALLADTGHNLSDVLGLLLAWSAMRLSQHLPTR